MASCSFISRVYFRDRSKFTYRKNVLQTGNINSFTHQLTSNVHHFKFVESYLAIKLNLKRCLQTHHANLIKKEAQDNEKDCNKKNDDSKNNDSENKDIVSKKISRYHKFTNILKSFGLGCKALLIDVKLALQTRRKLGLYKYQENLSAISRDDLLHMRQTRRDVAKTFPVAMLFMVPFLGYAAPIIAYFYPKQFLSQQFWHPDQKKEFILEEYEKRSQYYIPLIKEVGIISKEIKNKQLLQFCLKVLDGKHPENNELLQFRDIFSQHEEFSLNKMTRYHLIKLCRCWLIPTGWFLPRWYLVSSLRKRISHLHEDDILILRDGVDMLTPSCIEHAVHVRGLDEFSLCIDAKRHWITEWVQLSSKVEKIKSKRIMKELLDRNAAGLGDQATFLAHCAVFKAANFEAAAQKEFKQV